jgi:hypothetical protein
MRAHADDDASCEVLYGGTDADAGAEAGSLALRLVRVCGPGKVGSGEQMPRWEHRIDARRTPPQLVEKSKDKTMPGLGPRQPGRVRSGARHRRVKQRMLYAHMARHPPSCLRLPWLPFPSSLHSPILPYSHHAPAPLANPCLFPLDRSAHACERAA